MTACSLCDRPLPVDREGDYWCYGCESYVCDEHPSPLITGDHAPEAHEEAVS
jgi:hypothetical protein